MSSDTLDFPLKPRTGRELRSIYEAFNPLDSQGQLKHESELITILAANANYPLELQINAFAQASAETDSPIIIQVSGTATQMSGGDAKKMKLTTPRYGEIRPVAIGARETYNLMSKFASLYNADMMFMGLDHFTSPAMPKEETDTPDRAHTVKNEIALARIYHAARVLQMRNQSNLDEKTINRYVNYMISPEYQSFRKDFLSAIRFGNPTWAMMDTGNLPIILNFATSKDLTDAVRNELNNQDVILEAEISATGQSGSESGYKYWREDPTGKKNILTEQERREELTLTQYFRQYTGADAIAYEIGMEHAAKFGESHEPDEEKLREVQYALSQSAGRHIPFAQHGGSGSSKVIRGLVGKMNVNTQFLYEATEAERLWAEKNSPEIQARSKKAVGTDRFLEEITRVKAATIDYFKQTGTYGMAPRLREILQTTKPTLPTYNDFGMKATE